MESTLRWHLESLEVSAEPEHAPTRIKAWFVVQLHTHLGPSARQVCDLTASNT